MIPWGSLGRIWLVLIVACMASCALAGECNRIPGVWVCRVCGWKNPFGARYCRRDHQDLDAQRRAFEKSRTPVLQARPSRVLRGSSTLLRWYTRCATQVSIEPGIGVVAPF